jgi:hypothetical protein
MLCHFDINCLLQYELFYSGPPDYFFVQMSCKTMCNCMVFSLCDFHMPFHKLLKFVALYKRLATQSATVWLLACVNSHMPFQLADLGKQFATQCATVWLFACVHSHVQIKVVTLCK